jgi:hypothetical protein
LGIGRSPGGLGGLCRIDGLLQVGCSAEADICLNLTLIGVIDVALPLS